MGTINTNPLFNYDSTDYGQRRQPREQPWQQQNAAPQAPQQQQPGMMFPPSQWTPQAVQALGAQQFQQKRQSANSPADDWKQGMWASVPGSRGGAPAAPFSWDQPAFHLSPEAMQYHLQRNLAANPNPMHVQSLGLPFANTVNPDGSYNPNAPIQNRSPFSQFGMGEGNPQTQFGGVQWPQATQPLQGYQQGTPDPQYLPAKGWPQMTGNFSF